MLKDVTATSDVNSKFEIINLGDATQTLELTVELLDPAIITIELTGTTGGAAYNNYKITDVPRTDGSTVEVKITSPQGVTASTLSSRSPLPRPLPLQEPLRRMLPAARHSP